MSHLAFHRAPAPLTLAAVALEAGARLADGADPSIPIRALAPLDRAEADDVSAYFDGLDPDDLRTTRAGACLVAVPFLGLVPRRTAALVTATPREAFARLAAKLHPQSLRPGSAIGGSGVDKGARVDPTATLEAGVTVDPGAVVGPGVEIGAGTFIGANAVVGAGTRIGRGCAIDASVSISHALIGDRVVVHAGARLGQGGRVAAALREPSLGRVIVQNDVEIGANATIARGDLDDTVIGEGARVDASAVVAAGRIVARHARVRVGDAG